MKKTIAMLAFLSCSSAYAGNYGAHGCGLGSMVFTDTSSLAHQVLGATTNGTSGNQTFGMTTGTSNCELDETNANAQVVYIEANRVALANDIARGEGQTLNGFSQIYGCQSSAVAPVLKSNYSTIFASQNAQDIHSAIQSVITTNNVCI